MIGATMMVMTVVMGVGGSSMVRTPTFFYTPTFHHTPSIFHPPTLYSHEFLVTRLAADPSDANLPCDAKGFYIHPKNCSRFYRCVDYVGTGDLFSRYVFECPAGHVFAAVKATCVPGTCQDNLSPSMSPPTSPMQPPADTTQPPNVIPGEVFSTEGPVPPQTEGPVPPPPCQTEGPVPPQTEGPVPPQTEGPCHPKQKALCHPKQKALCHPKQKALCAPPQTEGPVPPCATPNRRPRATPNRSPRATPNRRPRATPNRSPRATPNRSPGHRHHPGSFTSGRKLYLRQLYTGLHTDSSTLYPRQTCTGARYVQHETHCNVYHPCDNDRLRYVCPAGTVFDQPRQMCRLSSFDEGLCTNKAILPVNYLRTELVEGHLQLPESFEMPHVTPDNIVQSPSSFQGAVQPLLSGTHLVASPTTSDLFRTAEFVYRPSMKQPINPIHLPAYSPFPYTIFLPRNLGA
ncbi:putative vegetative cell wall protein gp1-like 17 [Homarus americanus]|uniref:Putative vegetative cell wall protein gp1-like 17 n=1 Tax=Homarus americanus TaxID=6706 RepID=A0A8J5MK51_HOMAM|nr:putative vegetative cell wall protein gp1-like 17 [Homarus americanus]